MKWNESETQLLEEYYHIYTQKEIADALERSRGSIDGKSKRMGLNSKDGLKMLKNIQSTPKIDLEKIPVEFICGFIAAEGHFAIVEQEGRPNPKHTLTIEVASDDKRMIEDIHNWIGCGEIYEYSERNERCKPVTKLVIQDSGSIYKRVLPLCDKCMFYNSEKKEQYKKWKSSFLDKIDFSALKKRRNSQFELY